MTAEDLAHLRALEKAATPGPWFPWHRGDVDDWLCLFGDPTMPKWPEDASVLTESNASLIAALRNHAKSLLDAAEENARLREELKNVNAQLKGAVTTCHEFRAALSKIANSNPYSDYAFDDPLHGAIGIARAALKARGRP